MSIAYIVSAIGYESTLPVGKVVFAVYFIQAFTGDAAVGIQVGLTGFFEDTVQKFTVFTGSVGETGGKFTVGSVGIVFTNTNNAAPSYVVIIAIQFIQTGTNSNTVLIEIKNTVFF